MLINKLKQILLSDSALSCTMAVEDTIDRIFETCQSNHQCIEAMTGVPVYGLHGDSERTNSNPSLDIDGSASDIPDQLMDGTKWEIMGNFDFHLIICNHVILHGWYHYSGHLYINSDFNFCINGSDVAQWHIIPHW